MNRHYRVTQEYPESKSVISHKVLLNKELFLYLASFCSDSDAIKLFQISKYQSSLTQFYKLYKRYNFDKLDQKGFLIRSLNLSLNDISVFYSNYDLIFNNNSTLFREQIINEYNEEIRTRSILSVLNLDENQDFKDQFFQKIYSAKLNHTLSLASRYKNVEQIDLMDTTAFSTRNIEYIEKAKTRTEQILTTSIRKFDLGLIDGIEIESNAEPISLDVYRLSDLHLNFRSLQILDVYHLEISFENNLISSSLYQLPVLKELRIDSIEIVKTDKENNKPTTRIFPRSLQKLKVYHDEFLAFSCIRLDIEELINLEDLNYTIHGSYTELKFTKLTKLKTLEILFPLNPISKSVQNLTIDLPSSGDTVLSDADLRKGLHDFDSYKIADFLNQFNNNTNLRNLQFVAGDFSGGLGFNITNLPQGLKSFVFVDLEESINITDLPESLEELHIITSSKLVTNLNPGLLKLELDAESVILSDPLPETLKDLRIHVSKDEAEDDIDFSRLGDLGEKIEKWRPKVVNLNLILD